MQNSITRVLFRRYRKQVGRVHGEEGGEREHTSAAGVRGGYRPVPSPASDSQPKNYRVARMSRGMDTNAAFHRHCAAARTAQRLLRRSASAEKAGPWEASEATATLRTVRGAAHQPEVPCPEGPRVLTLWPSNLQKPVRVSSKCSISRERKSVALNTQLAIGAHGLQRVIGEASREAGRVV